jgi:hypothetical protein
MIGDLDLQLGKNNQFTNRNIVDISTLNVENISKGKIKK